LYLEENGQLAKTSRVSSDVRLLDHALGVEVGAPAPHNSNLIERRPGRGIQTSGFWLIELKVL
jgi:hypothetical protein